MQSDSERELQALSDADLASLIEERLREIDISLVVAVQENRVTLRGAVRNAALKKQALEIARRSVAAGAIIEEIDILPSEPEPSHPRPRRLRVREAEPEIMDRFVTDITHTLEDAQPFFPPTDPVVALGPHGPEVRGGFSATSMDQVSEDVVTNGPEAGPPGDEAIADDVRRELSEDAMTAHLQIGVAVRNGVVTLRGTVSDLEDADAAEEVASRVPGVAEVRDDLVVLGL